MEQIIDWMHLSASNVGTQLSGYMASSLVLLTFTMTSMRCLRLIAIASNCAFITYAILDDLRPILILHILLLPLNVFRLYQIENQRYRDRMRIDKYGKFLVTPYQVFHKAGDHAESSSADDLSRNSYSLRPRRPLETGNAHPDHRL